MSDLVCVEIDIAAPIDEVFALAMDPARTSEWVTISRGVVGSEGSYDTRGFRMDQKLCLRGVTFKVHWELVEVDAPNYARFEGRGPVRSKAFIENRLEERDGVTHYEYRNEFKAPFGPLGSTAQRVLAGGVPEREATQSLQNLKRLAESRVRA
jgi:uncharacterized protein YndB with AHSA1/START domain